MRHIDYESAVYWDVLVFPITFMAVGLVLAYCCYIDAIRAQEPRLLRLYLAASSGFLSTAICLAFLVANDLWMVTAAMSGKNPTPIQITLDRIGNALLLLSLALAVGFATAAILRRLLKLRSEGRA